MSRIIRYRLSRPLCRATLALPSSADALVKKICRRKNLSPALTGSSVRRRIKARGRAFGELDPKDPRTR